MINKNTMIFGAKSNSSYSAILFEVILLLFEAIFDASSEVHIFVMPCLKESKYTSFEKYAGKSYIMDRNVTYFLTVSLLFLYLTLNGNIHR